MQYTIPLQPPSVICMGAAGSGKTYALASLIRAGLETFVITTEPGGVESLLDACEATNADINKLHWTTCMPISPGWGAVEEMIKVIGSQGFEDIQKIKSGVGKADTRVAGMKFLTALKNFHCERTNENYGDVTLWDHNRALVIDSLSGWSTISLMLTIGYKPSAHQGEWGLAMNWIENMLLKISSDRRCFFVLTAHVEKEINEISGASQVMVSTLGKKLPPKVPKYFSEVVYAKRTMADDNSAKFTWATVDRAADLKNRALPISANLAPDYAPIVAAYRRRLELASAPSPTEPSEGTKPISASAQISAIVSKAQPAMATLKKE